MPIPAKSPLYYVHKKAPQRFSELKEIAEMNENEPETWEAVRMEGRLVEAEMFMGIIEDGMFAKKKAKVVTKPEPTKPEKQKQIKYMIYGTDMKLYLNYNKAWVQDIKDARHFNTRDSAEKLTTNWTKQKFQIIKVFV